MNKLILFAGILAILPGCINAGQHRAEIRDTSADRISIANVQREIKVGLSGAEVIAALGSPNMVTTDSQRRETWIYDKVSTERVYSTSEGGLGLLLGGAATGGSSGGFGGLGGMFSKSAGAASTSQRTLTIIIKFDNNGFVRDYSYRQSSF